MSDQGCKWPLHHSSAQRGVQDTGLGVQAASPSQLSMEQGLRHKAGGMEQFGMDTMTFQLFLALRDLIWSLNCQDSIRQLSIHPLNPPCGCSGTQGRGSLVGLAALPVVRSIPCRAPGRELPPLLSHHSVFYFACRSRRWPSDVSASRPFSWLLEMVDGLSL